MSHSETSGETKGVKALLKPSLNWLFVFMPALKH